MPSPNSWRWMLDRLFEWVMALAMLGLGLHLLVWPAAVKSSAFRYVLEILPASLLTLACLGVASLSIAALTMNGRWAYGPVIRGLTALVRCSIWLQMLIALAKIAPEAGTPSPGLPIYTMLVVGELIAIFMAAADERFPRFR